MTLACRELLDVLGHSFKDKIEPHFALTTMLEHRVRNGEMNTACKLFFCVSDISRTTHSRALAEVLHSFFTKCGDEIIGQEDHAHVVYWGCAVMISNMSDSQKLDCIHIILKGFPELMLDSDYIGYNQPVVGMEYFVTAMHRVAEMDDDLHYGDRGRRRLREDNFLRRRRLGNNRLGSWHDDSLGYGSGYNSPFDSLREGLSMRPTKEMVRDVQQLYNNQKQLKDHVEFLTDAVEELRQDGFDGDFNGSDDWNHPRRVRSLEEDY
ncbi:hypothetical protein K490DRAFT_55304 [Saccharata proteae CBS 121410]|uniref:Uncharacterized protein n=1 Tax=Saccharata proteae CBS 121410 TaxID=1314787 RepID=A0A6A5YDE9_9PEZI|nr:hypothetical protein K490DRAFT_55304 [Saccharata proteae CBS 121410]